MSLYVDIEKRYGTFQLKMKFESGDEVLSLLGASGCGKSLTLKCIAGIETPDRGRIVLDGKVLFDSESQELSKKGHYLVKISQQGMDEYLEGLSRKVPKTNYNRLESLYMTLFTIKFKKNSFF